MNNLPISIGLAIFSFSPSIIDRHNLVSSTNKVRQIAVVANKSICQKTLDSIQSQLRVVKSVKLKPIGTDYTKYPRDRSMVVDFSIYNNNPRSEKTIAATSQLLAASQRIAKNCANVGMVQFYIDQTDNGVVYGIVNKKMKQFVCKNELPIKWGETMCP